MSKTRSLKAPSSLATQRINDNYGMMRTTEKDTEIHRWGSDKLCPHWGEVRRGRRVRQSCLEEMKSEQDFLEVWRWLGRKGISGKEASMYAPPWRWAQQFGLLSVAVWGEGEGAEQEQEKRGEQSQGAVYSSPCSRLYCPVGQPLAMCGHCS